MPRRTNQMIEAGLCGNGLHPWVDGQPQCMDCQREAKRRWYEANPERHRENNRRWLDANPERHREQGRRWQDANPEKERERKRRYREAHPEKGREYQRRRRARRNNNGVYVVSDKDLRRLQQQPCAHAHLGPCNGHMHVDHIVPVSRGGTHGIGNLQRLCQRHNISKHDRLEVEVTRKKHSSATAEQELLPMT